MKQTILILTFCILCSKAFTQTNEITVNISGIRVDKGKCVIYLFNTKKGFPENPAHAIRTVTGKIASNKCSLTIKDLGAGEYAISVLHDENDNGEMDTNFMGIPKEGTGASNNPQGADGPPTFAEAKFQFNGSKQTISIVINYL